MVKQSSPRPANGLPFLKKEDELFDGLFSRMRSGLSSGTTLNVVTDRQLEVGFDSTEQFLANLLTPSSSSTLALEARQRARARLDAVEHRRRLSHRMHEYRLEALRSRSRHFSASVSSALSALQLQHLQFERRLRQQSTTVTRRLQELAYECYGEMEKARLRACLCSQTHQDDFDLRSQDSVETLLWNVFLQRLNEDTLGAVEITDMHPRCGREGRAAFEDLAADFEGELRQTPSIAAQCGLEVGWNSSGGDGGGTGGSAVRVHRVLCVQRAPGHAFDEAAVAARNLQRRARARHQGPRLVQLCMNQDGGDRLLDSLFSESHIFAAPRTKGSAPGRGSGGSGGGSKHNGRSRTGSESKGADAKGGGTRPWSAVADRGEASGGGGMAASDSRHTSSTANLGRLEKRTIDGTSDADSGAGGTTVAGAALPRRQTPRGTRRLPLFRATTPLSAHAVQWLLGHEFAVAPPATELSESAGPTSRLRSLVTPRVFYCLEERAACVEKMGTGSFGNYDDPASSEAKAASPTTDACRRSTVVAAAVSEFLASVYAKNNARGNALLRGGGGGGPSARLRALAGGGVGGAGGLLRVSRSDGRHRHHYLAHAPKAPQEGGGGAVGDGASGGNNVHAELITHYPDVLVAEVGGRGESKHEDSACGGQLHFAPATVLQLVECARFAKLAETCAAPVERATLRKHYPNVPGAARVGAVGSLYVLVPTAAASSPVVWAEQQQQRVLERLRRTNSPERHRKAETPSAEPDVAKGAVLLALPPAAIDELVATFLLRNPASHVPFGM